MPAFFISVWREEARKGEEGEGAQVTDKSSGRERRGPRQNQAAMLEAGRGAPSSYLVAEQEHFRYQGGVVRGENWRHPRDGPTNRDDGGIVPSLKLLKNKANKQGRNLRKGGKGDQVNNRLPCHGASCRPTETSHR